ncbi:oxaloacetate decarboxylase subunit gamma [Vibrio viridaestus]|uniref:Probable oxaloacetate decarboxylase gamma chain n=1 Tax=Vibrio viridaestus TaxID=2487322 RepID=A0A3N9TFB8_9VIBR|nr:oxaloacetate decarboxylase subunit gamma [Vibrio viridaestus]RQW62931.1 oxaloacetate decarboxylase subunit gamma [Vibrio viridaestus]
MDNTIGSLLWQAAAIMVTGMGVVFLFLSIMVFLVGLMSKLIPQEAPPQLSRKVSSATSTPSGVEPQVVAAISAAVHQYRMNHKSK